MKIYYDPNTGIAIPDNKVLQHVEELFSTYNANPDAFDKICYTVGQELIILAIRAYCKKHRVSGVKVYCGDNICYIHPNGSIDHEFWDSRYNPELYDSLLSQLLKARYP